MSPAGAFQSPPPAGGLVNTGWSVELRALACRTRSRAVHMATLFRCPSWSAAVGTSAAPLSAALTRCSPGVATWRSPR